MHQSVIHSPLAGCSDFPFRLMCRRYSQSLLYCEMVKMEALLRGDFGSFGLLGYSPEMHPIGAQLVGSNPKIAGEAARIIEDLGFDVLDLNCGCPVDKVTKDGSGSGMLRQPERIGEVLAEMVAAVRIPVTLKIRAGWTAEEIVAPKIARVARDAGAAMIAIHGRTRAQGYKGLADRDVIRAAKRAVGNFPVAGNGDIFDAESALHMFDHTGCDAILISRGTMGQPWLAQDIERSLQGLSPLCRGPEEALEALLEHIALIVQYRSDRRATLDTRRVACWYCKAAPGIASLRSRLARINHPADAVQAIRKFQSDLDSNCLLKSPLCG